MVIASRPVVTLVFGTCGLSRGMTSACFGVSVSGNKLVPSLPSRTQYNVKVIGCKEIISILYLIGLDCNLAEHFLHSDVSHFDDSSERVSLLGILSNIACLLCWIAILGAFLNTSTVHALGFDLVFLTILKYASCAFSWSSGFVHNMKTSKHSVLTVVILAIPNGSEISTWWGLPSTWN